MELARVNRSERCISLYKKLQISYTGIRRSPGSERRFDQSISTRATGKLSTNRQRASGDKSGLRSLLRFFGFSSLFKIRSQFR